MSTEFPMQPLTAIYMDGKAYEILDTRLRVLGEEAPVVRDPNGRLCVFSRSVALMAGYQQLDSLSRLVLRNARGYFAEGETHQGVTTEFIRSLPQEEVFAALFHRVRAPEVLLYSDSFQYLGKVAKMPNLHFPCEALQLLEQREAFYWLSGGGPPCGECESRASEVPKVTDDLVDAWIETSLQPLIPSPVEVMEAPTPVVYTEEQCVELVLDLSATVDVPVPEEFLKQKLGDPPVRKPLPSNPPRPLPALQIDLQELLGPKSLALTRSWVPPGYPEEFEDVRGNWVGSIYSWALARQVEASSTSLGANLPNIPLLLEQLLKVWGLLNDQGCPTLAGKYFALREISGGLSLHKGLLPKLFIAFLVMNPMVNYTVLQNLTTPTKDSSDFNLQEVRKLIRDYIRSQS